MNALAVVLLLAIAEPPRGETALPASDRVTAQTRSPRPAPVKTPVSPAARAMMISEHGYGPARVGVTHRQVEQALRVRLRSVAELDECAISYVQSGPGRGVSASPSYSCVVG